MIDFLEALDDSLFEWVNRGLENQFFDFLMPWLREAKIWIPIYVLFIILIIHKKRSKPWLWIIALALSVGAADYLASGVFKPTFKSVRPCHDCSMKESVILRKRDGNCGGRYGFASSHAANHFAMALYMSLVLGFSNKSFWRWLLLFWAGSIAFAQVYVGVHFPGDVLVGALLGYFAAQILYRITLFAEQKIYP